MQRKTIIGGAIGLLVIVLVLILRSIIKNPIDIFAVIETCLYGILTGAICRGFIIKTTEDSAIKNSGIVFLITLLLGVLISIIVMIGFFLIRFMPIMGLPITFRTIGFNITRAFFNGLRQGLIVGVICSVSAFVFIKISLKKGLLPIIENKTSNENVSLENTTQVQSGEISESKFDGGVFELIGRYIIGFLLTLLTLGICFPWAVCMIYTWQINHTIIEGRRLKFHGKAIGLFGTWIKCLLLCLITLGIYSLWVPVTLEKWKVKNITFAEPTTSP
jgi:hypothetical protein